MSGDQRPGEQADRWHGHPSRAHLEYWLDKQVVAERLTEAQARLYLPDYQAPPADDCCPVYPLAPDDDRPAVRAARRYLVANGIGDDARIPDHVFNRTPDDRAHERDAAADDTAGW